MLIGNVCFHFRCLIAQQVYFYVARGGFAYVNSIVQRLHFLREAVQNRKRHSKYEKTFVYSRFYLRFVC